MISRSLLLASQIASTLGAYWIGTATLANRPLPGSINEAAWIETMAKQYKAQCSTSQAIQMFFDPTSGSDINDGRDGIVKASSTSFTWTESTKTLTKTGAFASYTFSPGDKIYVSGGTAVTAGLYTIASRVSNDAVTLTSTIVTNASNPTDVSVSTGPKQTGTAVNTAIALGGRRILIKGGSQMGFATGLLIGVADVSIGTYGNGKRAEITTRDTAQACGGSWTSAGSNVYYVTRAAASVVGGVREKGTYRFYAFTSSLAECQALPGSFWHDTATNRLYVHHYFNLNLTTATDPAVLEFFPGNNIKDGILVNGTAGNVSVENIDIVGFGACNTVTRNKWYGIHGELSGTNVLCCTNVGVFLNNDHNIGNTSSVTGTGGILVCFGCQVGYVTYPDTPFVGYAANGANEMYLVDCEVLAGDVLRIASGVPNYTYGCSQVAAWLMHTDGIGSHYIGFGATLRLRCVRGPMQVFAPGAVANASPTTTDIMSCRGLNKDLVYEAWVPTAKDNTVRVAATTGTGCCPVQILGGNIVDGFDTVYSGCRIECRSQWYGTASDVFGAVDQVGGYHINGTFVVDGSLIESGDRTATWAYGLVNTAANLKCTMQNCHVHFRGLPGQKVGLVAHSAYGNAASSADCTVKFAIYDSIVTAEGANVSAYFHLSSGNNRDYTAAGAKWSPTRVKNIATNAPYLTDTYRGNDQTDNLIFLQGWQPGRAPEVGSLLDAAPTALLGGQYLSHDAQGFARRAGVCSIGPVEAR